jgi:hypothetical protein
MSKLLLLCDEGEPSRLAADALDRAGLEYRISSASSGSSSPPILQTETHNYHGLEEIKGYAECYGFQAT